MPPIVLIVDDDADLRESLSRVLAPALRTAQASNGEEALAAIEKHQPGLVFLDVSMPGMDGLEVLRRARQAFPSLPIVMLTSHQDIDLARRALALGAAEYVTKPFDADYIRAEAARLLGAPPPEEKPWKVVP